MILTVLKDSYVKRGPRTTEYRDDNKFNILAFRQSIIYTINKLSEKINFDSMNNELIKVLNQHAPN